MVACCVATFSRAEFDREPIVAVVDGCDHVAGANPRVVRDRDAGNVTRHLGGECGVVGLDVGVVGRDRETADGPPAVAEPARSADGEYQPSAEGKRTVADPSTLVPARRRGWGVLGEVRLRRG